MSLSWTRAGGGILVALALLLFGTAAGAGANRSDDLPGFRHGTVAVDGGNLHFVRGGSGPPLVLLHGWPETWWSWHKVMPALAEDNTVIAFDLPGLGRSGIAADGYDAATVARRIRQGVTKLGYPRVRILAHDLGTLVAYPYARDFPAEVSRMAVLEAPLNGFGLEDAYGFSWHFLFNATAPPVPEKIINDQDHVRTYLGWIFSSARYPARIDQETFFRAYANPARRSAGYNYYRAFTANAADNRANAGRRLTMPVLAMGAEFVFGPGVAGSFRQVADDVRQVVAPDSGHWIAEEQPQFLIRCANFFFGDSGTPPPELASCAR